MTTQCMWTSDQSQTPCMEPWDYLPHGFRKVGLHMGELCILASAKSSKEVQEQRGSDRPLSSVGVEEGSTF